MSLTPREARQRPLTHRPFAGLCVSSTGAIYPARRGVTSRRYVYKPPAR